MLELKNSNDSKPAWSICSAAPSMASVFMFNAQRLCWPSRSVVSTKEISFIAV